MDLNSILTLYKESDQTKQIIDSLSAARNCVIHLKGLTGSASAFIASAVMQQKSYTHLFILADKEEAAYFFNDLENLSGENVLFFPASYRTPYEFDKTDNANILLRAEVLNTINKSTKALAIVTYPEALIERVVTKSHLRKNTLELKKGEKVSIDFISDVLFEYGFERVDYVIEPGQFAVRGGIIDVYSFSNDNPFRIELFGDEVDSLRTFDTVNQLSIKNHAVISIIPNVQDKLLKESRESFFDYLPKDTKLWVNDFAFTCQKIEKEFDLANSAYNKHRSVIDQLPPHELYIDKKTFIEQSSALCILETGTKPYFNSTLAISYHFIPQPVFNKNFELLTSNLSGNTQSGFKNIIFSDSAKQVERIYAIFEDIGKNIDFQPIQLSIHEGFVDKDLKLACYTDHQIFDRYHRFRLKNSFNKKNEALTLKELKGLNPGDFITHIDHGVGRYAGLEKIDVNGKLQEAIKLVYKDNDILYISIHSLHRISKYSGKEGTEPKINKLGSNAWANLKQKTKKKVKEIAFDLIQLYAKRRKLQGFQFSQDTYLQNELEASFIYEDTPDQIKTTIDVKKDMESSFPMDRLVCGDVGFGKTEIAVRAAFKAVTDNKQVAVLVPTTILALQHYKTFKERLKVFPCKVDYINRFKSTREQNETLKKLAEGKIDIIIGTHRLVGKDIKFKDLGLLILDEEQKFGVSVKEKLKTIKVNVDTLTLTATPIPRTLQFSMMGARDLSVINTPPPNRYPVQTELHSFNEEVIRDAISYEVSRGGQAFFVHNRIQNLNEIAGLIQKLCPDVKVLAAHGQMEGDKLEQVMLDFIEGNADVLIATSIIESGLDMPNVNTIIINNAHFFGLSDLHQLRGRVGRSNKKAFCYLLAPPASTLTTEARKRLKAIEEFSDLGSGFHIAMRDLDIRGAGNLLGAEQSGFISEIGLDMYQKILDEAMQELKEEEFKDLYASIENQPAQTHFVKDCQIDTDMEILIPDSYVNNVTERLSLYRELDEAKTEAELGNFEVRLKDRFGPLPPQTVELISTIRLRWLAIHAGLEKLVLKNGKLVGYFVSNQKSPYYQSETFSKVLQYVQQNTHVSKMKESNNKLTLTIDKIKTIDAAIIALSSIIN